MRTELIVTYGCSLRAGRRGEREGEGKREEGMRGGDQLEGGRWGGAVSFRWELILIYKV